MMRRNKLLIGIIILFLIGILINNKPILKVIEVRSNTYKTPANNAFTDQIFYNCVIDAYNLENNADLDYDVSLTDEQLETITSLSCSGRNKADEDKIVNTNGIEKLTQLESLVLSDNLIQSIDLSHNLLLESLNLSSNELNSIDLSNNIALTSLNLGWNEISSINLEYNTALVFLSLNDNVIDDIDLSNNTALYFLELQNNNLDSINLNNNTDLTSLFLDENVITSIDLSYNVKLKKLSLNKNSLSDINLSYNTLLEELSLNENEIDSINLDSNVSLSKVSLISNKLSSIDLSHNTLLTSLSLDKNEISSISLNNNSLLSYLSLEDNKISSIDLSHNTALTSLYLRKNKISSINLSSNTSLTSLILEDNLIRNIDLSHNAALLNLRLGWNKIENIDLSHNTSLEKLQLQSNKISDIDLNNNTALIELDLDGNNLKYFDLSNNTSITKLFVNSQKEYIYLNKYECSSLTFDDSVLLRFLQAGSYESNACSLYNDLSSNWTGDPIHFYTNYDFYYLDKNSEDQYYNFDYYIYPQYINSDKYIIDDDNNYIYTEYDLDNEEILQNIEFVNVDYSIENNKLIVKYNDDFIKEYYIVNIHSEKYVLDRDYLYGDFDDMLDNISVTNGNLSLNLITNKVSLKFNNIVIRQFDYINCTSSKYDLSGSHINVVDDDISTFLGAFNCVNCNTYVTQNQENFVNGAFDGSGYTLSIMFNDTKVKRFHLDFPIYGVSLNKDVLKLDHDTKTTYQLIADIMPANALNKNVTWVSSNPSVASVDETGLVTAVGNGNTLITVTTEDGEFTDSCSVSVGDSLMYTVTFRDGDNTYTADFAEDEDVLFKTDLDKPGYSLVGWRYNGNDYSLTDKLFMPGNDIELTAIWELVVPDVSNYNLNGDNITGISLKTGVDNIDLGIGSIYTTQVFNHDGLYKTYGFVGTGDTIKIYLNDQVVVEYEAIVKGDVTGTGTVAVSDVAKLYQYLKGKISMDDCYIKAGNVVSSDNDIKINDVAKLYQFVKGRISNL